GVGPFLDPTHPAYNHLRGYWPLKDGHGSVAADLAPSHNFGELFNGTFWNGGRSSLARNCSVTISNLMPGTIYHFRAVGTNLGGVCFGSDQTFTTLRLPQVVDFRVQPGSAFLLSFTRETASSFSIDGS